MTNAAIQHLLAAIGTSHITAFFLVLARVAPLFIVAPLFSSTLIPTQARTVIAVALAIGLTPIVDHGQTIPSSPFAIGGLIAEQFLVGGALAFAMATMFAAIEAAGSLLDAVAGFSFGAILNPLTGNQDAVLSRLYAMVGTAIFIAIGGDGYALRGLGRTFQLIPLTGTPPLRSIVAGSVALFANICTAALEIGAPVILAVLVTDIAFGMVSRVVPQLNVYAVGFPVKIGVALLAVTASLPFLGGWMTGQLADSVGFALRELGAV
jgi:flagellar biosynthetic protein FliR